MSDSLLGTGVALVTPFDKDLKIDFDALDNLLAHTSTGVDYFVVQGTTGESPTTSASEKREVLEFIKSNNPKSLPIVYGAGGNNTSSVINHINTTELQGIDAVLSVSPYYNKPSQQGLIAHYQAIADQSPVPIILYNVPGRTSSNLTADTTLALAEHANIIGIKEASGDLEQCREIAQHMPEDFLLISGDDLLTVEMIKIGAKGVISVLANAYPMIFKDAVDRALDGVEVLKEEFVGRLLEINELMYVESNPVGIKQLLQQLGICQNYVRLPLLAASDQLQARIADNLL